MSSDLKRERLYVFILAALQFCHILDFVIMMPLGPMFMREFDITPAQFGILVSSYNLSGAPFTLLVGFVADRFDRKSFILANLLGFILATVYCGLSSTFEQLVIARILAGAFGGTLNAAIFAVIADLIPEIRRGQATGTVMSSFSVASVLGVPLGLTIATAYNWHHTFLFIAAVTVVIWFAVLVYIPKMRGHLGEPFNLKNLYKHYTSVAMNPNYRMSFLFIICIGFASFLLIPFISPFAVSNIGVSEKDLRLIYLFGGAFTFFSARYIGKLCDQWGSLKTFYLVALLSLIPISIYTHLENTSLAVTIIVTTFFMMTVSGRFVPCVTMATHNPSPKDRGVFMSFFNALRALSTASAAYVAGLIVSEGSMGELIGYEKVGYFSIVMALLCFYPATRLYKQITLKPVS